VKKVAQNVLPNITCQTLCIALTVEKICPKCGILFVIFKKLALPAGLPDFSWSKHTKLGKI
jgi:hypothetical protein